MPVRVSGIMETEIMLVQVAENTKRRAVRKLHEKALEIAALARKYAPLDEGNLEKAIKVFPETIGERLRNEAGQFVRQEVFVYVDVDMPVPDRPGETVGKYAYTMHEHLTPFGPYNLGEKSANKQSGQREMVGGKYLERAMNEVGDTVIGAVTLSVMNRFDY